ncbi:hypothetical protein ACJX0J_023893 [Zea mays]
MHNKYSEYLGHVLPLYKKTLITFHIFQGEWNVAGIAHRAYDLEGKTVGTIDPELEKEIGAKFEEDLDAMLPKFVFIILTMKKGVIVVNNARGAIMDARAVVDACSSGHIAGTYYVNMFSLSLYTTLIVCLCTLSP